MTAHYKIHFRHNKVTAKIHKLDTQEIWLGNNFNENIYFHEFAKHRHRLFVRDIGYLTSTSYAQINRLLNIQPDVIKSKELYIIMNNQGVDFHAIIEFKVEL